MRMFLVDFDSIYLWDEETYPDHAKSNPANKAKIEKRGLFLQMAGVVMDDRFDARYPQNIVLTGEQLLDATMAGFEFRVKQEVTIERSVEGMLTKFNHMAEKLLALPMPERVYNEKVEVHIPGQALSNYNEIRLLEDSCSDSLQAAIDEGWRIIAACPQPNQRRPDYILGRFNPERRVNQHGAAGR